MVLHEVLHFNRQSKLFLRYGSRRRRCSGHAPTRRRVLRCVRAADIHALEFLGNRAVRPAEDGGSIGGSSARATMRQSLLDADLAEVFEQKRLQSSVAELHVDTGRADIADVDDQWQAVCQQADLTVRGAKVLGFVVRWRVVIVLRKKIQ